MKRHPALVRFSHDHHHGLVAARRLRRAANDEPAALPQTTRDFLAFFEEETTVHFREEEDRLFPLLLEHVDAPPEPLRRALAEHETMRGLAGRLRSQAAAGAVEARTATELGLLVEHHIRGEERVLFPLIKEVVPPDELETLAPP